jgi:PAS domain S-box-containing protein
VSKRCPICAKAYPPEERFCSIHGLPLVEEIHAHSKETGELTGHVLDGRYRLAGVAGRGGMGVVYEAEQLRIGRRCAVKVLHAEMVADPKMRMRLFREVQAASRIRHPNIVEILDFGDDEVAGCYLVMEFLGGRSLSEIIRTEQTLPLPLFFKIALQLSAALGATHAQGLIHRDLKPSNVRVLAGDQVKVLDFGLVKPFEPAAAKDFVTITTGGIAFGTPWYMSPEQATFQTLDQRTDVYSAGVMLYEMLVGRPPFTGDNPVDLIDAHRSRPVPLPSKIAPQIKIPPALEMIVLRMLEKNPAKRYGSASEVQEALQRVAQQVGILVVDEQTPQRASTQPSELLRPHDLTLPMPVVGGSALQELRRVVQDRLDEVAKKTMPSLRAIIPHYRTIADETLHENIKLSLQTALRVLDDPPLTELPDEMRRLADQRTGQDFTPTEIIVAMWLELAMMRPLIREVVGTEERFSEAEEQLDGRILSFVLLLVDYYYSRYHRRLVELNETLSQQNEELLRLRAALTEQVDQTSRQLVESEQLKSRVVESISSGLVLVDHNTLRVKLFNKALERLTGIPAGQAIGRVISDVISFIEGVPFEEFLEQVRMHGEVGLRKLWVRLSNGAQRAIYVRGQILTDAAGQHLGTLFVVDDVTEREHIIESFSRYLSRDVVEQVLHKGKGQQPTGETRRVVLLAANIRDFRGMIKDMPEAGIVELLSDYVHVVSDAVFHHGGVVDSVVADGVLVYFDSLRGACGPAVKAAIELVGRLEAVNQQRAGRGLLPIHVGIGIDVGDVLVANIGDKRRMAHTVIGEAALVAQALQEVASGGEILVSAAVAKAAGEGVVIENGPVVSVKGHSQPVEVFRVAFDPAVTVREPPTT